MYVYVPAVPLLRSEHPQDEQMEATLLRVLCNRKLVFGREGLLQGAATLFRALFSTCCVQSMNGKQTVM